MTTPITAFYAGLFGLLLINLSAPVAMARWRYRVGLGSGGEKKLEQYIRVQGNFTEYVPLALLLLLLNEMNGGSEMLLHSGGVTLLVARLLHAYGLSQRAGTSFGRMVGTTLTWLIMAALSIALIVGFLSG